MDVLMLLSKAGVREVGIDRVAKKRCNRHWTNPSWDRCDGPRNLERLQRERPL